MIGFWLYGGHVALSVASFHKRQNPIAPASPIARDPLLPFHKNHRRLGQLFESPTGAGYVDVVIPHFPINESDVCNIHCAHVFDICVCVCVCVSVCVCVCLWF